MQLKRIGSLVYWESFDRAFDLAKRMVDRRSSAHILRVC
ncbi:hypothetical protein NIES2104_54630 [Leptolyngbya sp. NIES-2104]|nr:hypothetical protein NIES2104_54630 [Leptolyngbya sp. NIES-2104]